MKNQRDHYSGFNGTGRGLTVTKIAGILACTAGLGLLGVFFAMEYRRAAIEEEYIEPAPVSDTLLPLEDSEASAESEEEADSGLTYQPGQLHSTPERGAYRDGDIQLLIPRLNYQGPVLDGTEEEVLARGVGLFTDWSLVPGPADQNANVSIAGQRTQGGAEFRDIDTMADGDRMYLLYKGDLYTYAFESIFITLPTDLEPLMVKEYPCLTLMSQSPIAQPGSEYSEYERIFVVGRLESVDEGVNEFPDAEMPAPSKEGASRLPEPGDAAAVPESQPEAPPAATSEPAAVPPEPESSASVPPESESASSVPDNYVPPVPEDAMAT